MRLALGIVAALAVSAPKAEAVSVQHKRNVVRPFSRYFDRVAACESTSRWHLNTGNGFYGGLQFTLSTWHGVGGVGYPNWASVLEQKYRGVLVLKTQGRRAWPRCG